MSEGVRPDAADQYDRLTEEIDQNAGEAAISRLTPVAPSISLASCRASIMSVFTGLLRWCTGYLLSEFSQPQAFLEVWKGEAPHIGSDHPDHSQIAQAGQLFGNVGYTPLRPIEARSSAHVKKHCPTVRRSCSKFVTFEEEGSGRPRGVPSGQAATVIA